MRLILASGNNHKRKELEGIFKNHPLLLPEELGIRFYHEETGSTFWENALGKAKSLFQEVEKRNIEGYSVLADDSGLSVEALGGAPGIYSARFGEQELGRKPTPEEQHRLLLDRMRHIPDRRARFICCMVLMVSKDRWFSAQETLEGELSFEPKGTGGFGYDPLLYIPSKGKTVAELSIEEKNRISHRGAAGKALRIIIEHHLEREDI
jgi:XTP/dITP diphosphohydrolase